MKEENIGSLFDSWLREEGIYDDVTAAAIKRILAGQSEAAMSNLDSAEPKLTSA